MKRLKEEKTRRFSILKMNILINNLYQFRKKYLALELQHGVPLALELQHNATNWH